MIVKNKNFRTNKDGEIELCSGLVDSNGELIYENDVLESSIHENRIFIVKFRGGEFHGEVHFDGGPWSLNLNFNPKYTKKAFTIVHKNKHS